MPLPWLFPALLAAGQVVGGLISQNRQAKHNRQLAESQNAANERYLQEQLQYNSPVSQMRRFQEAGLNPHLIYGQGNPGNQSQSLTYPDIKPTDYQGAFQNIGPLLNQSLLTQSQVQATDAKTRQTYVMTQLNELQKRVLEKNPLLDQAGFKAIIDALKSSAEIKGSEATLKGIESGFYKKTIEKEGEGEYYKGTIGEMKLWKEFDLLEQRFKLGSLDAKLKAQVVTSKEFQNVLLEIQKRWMADGEITPQHILNFIQMFLMKML